MKAYELEQTIKITGFTGLVLFIGGMLIHNLLTVIGAFLLGVAFGHAAIENKLFGEPPDHLSG